MQADFPDAGALRSGALTRALARFVSDTQWRDVPAAVRNEAKRSLVNYFAVALAGAHDPTLDRALDVYRRFRADETSTIIGRGERIDMLNAAALNAMSANVYDFDDTHVPTIIHPAAPVASALFALAESRPLGGATFMLAFALGVDVACRIGNAVSPEHYQRGSHITSTCGVFGAAAAVAKALALDERAIAWALGNASAQASGLVETLGTMAKSIGVGNAARNGLLSALLAERGFSGPDAPLEGERGFLRVSAAQPDWTALTRDAGRAWELSNNTYKPYPCGVVLNPVIDACIELRRDARWTLDDIEQIELTGHPLLRERTDRPHVRTGREAQVSAQHAVAVVLARGRAGLDEFGDAAVADPSLRAVAGKLRFVGDASWPIESAQVSIVLRSGERVSHRVHAARGSLAAPLANAELADKLRQLAAYGRSRIDPEPLLARLWAFETEPDAAAVVRLARART